MDSESLDPEVFISHSLEETDLFVSQLVKKIPPNSTIFLNGEIGAGKTYLCSRIASHFGVENLTSSSFGRVSMHPGDVNIVHCDFYRSKLNPEFFSLEVEPLLKAPWLLLVEWAKNEEQAIDTAKNMRMEIIHKGANSREIRLSVIN
jgi:tRNA threonylcarbamoyladenosine biosynthesis protein TsaE